MAKPAAKKPKPFVRRAAKAAAPAVKKIVAKAAKKATKKPGPLPWKPTKKDRELIQHCVAIGMTQEQVALVLDRSVDSLHRHAKRDLEAGQLIQNSKIGTSLFKKAFDGDVSALIFLAKTRLGFSEKHVIQHTGPEGGPVEVEHMTAKEAAERYRERLG